MLRALNAEARLFPDLHRRSFEEVVQPRRTALLNVLRRGIHPGQVRMEVDLDLAVDLLVDPTLAHSAVNQTLGPDALTSSQRPVDLVFAGLAPR